MKLTKKQLEVVNKFQELQKKHGNKIFISTMYNKPRFMKLDKVEGDKLHVTTGNEFGDFINSRVLNGLEEKGFIQPIDNHFNYLSRDEMYSCKHIGAIIVSK